MIRRNWILKLLTVLSVYSTILIEPLAADIIPMPKGFEGIYLGMSLDSFKKVKPNVIKDDWPYSALYFEKDLKNDYFTSVVYDFTDKMLLAITLEKSGTVDFIQSKVPGLIIGCIKKWGENYLKKVGIGEDIKTKEIKLYPVFYWERTDVKILLTYSAKRFSIHILNVKQKPPLKFRDAKDLKELEEVFKDVRTTENYSGPIFE